MHSYIIHITSKIQRKILPNLLAYNEKGKPCRTSLILLLAEGEGFKPPIPERGIPDFESSAFGHSANLPLRVMNLS